MAIARADQKDEKISFQSYRKNLNITLKKYGIDSMAKDIWGKSIEIATFFIHKDSKEEIANSFSLANTVIKMQIEFPIRIVLEYLNSNAIEILKRDKNQTLDVISEIV